MSLAAGVCEDGRGGNVDAVFFCTGEDCACELRLEVFGTITEVGLGGTYVCGVGHGVFASFGEPENAVG